jgi:NADH-quinone oxidoreductase subunit G
MDAVGSAIRVDTRGREVMRILPRLNEDVNEEWISDKTRFIWDGLRTQRLDRPYVRQRSLLRPATWGEAFAAITPHVKKAMPQRIGVIAGDLATVEEMFAFKRLMDLFTSPNFDCRQDGAHLDPSAGRASYLFNPTIAGIDNADAILIVGSDPRHEAAVLNARIRKRWRRGDLPVGLIGERVDLTYSYDYLGAGPETLAEMANGERSFGKVLAEAKRPLILVGPGALARPDGAAVLSLAAKIAVSGQRDEGWNGLAVLHQAASRVGGLDVGFVSAKGGLNAGAMVEAAGKGAFDVLFLLGADEIDMNALGKAFVVYIGTHGDAGAHRADVILPGAAYTEKSGTYVNTEGRVQMTRRAAFPPGEAREDWAIIRAMSESLGRRLPFDSLAELRAALYASHPRFARIGEVAPASLDEVKALAERKGVPTAAAFSLAVPDFYLTNPIARASAIMAECSALAAGRLATAAE